MSIELRRHVNALVSDFTAEYGEVDLVSRRVDYEELSELTLGSGARRI